MSVIRQLAANSIFLSLRPPCARNTIVTHGFASEASTNAGYTVRFPSVLEPVVAMGDGQVVRVTGGRPSWLSDYATMGNRSTFGVAIDHGYGVESFVGGLSAVEVNQGTQVTRGQRLGLPLTLEVFCHIRHAGGARHPARVNRNFEVYDQRFVPGDPKTVRFAPDVAPGRNLSSTSALPYLVNVDFAGSGHKEGKAAEGIGNQDFWNLYTPSNFTATLDYVCGSGGTVYSSSPVLWLSDWSGQPTTVRIEKRTEPHAPFYGDAGLWDPMLSTWLGGYDRYLPMETYYIVKGLPYGPLRVFFYASLGSTSFFLSVDGGQALTRSTTYVPGESRFVEGLNYVEFDGISLPRGPNSSLGVRVLGYLSGMQITR